LIELLPAEILIDKLYTQLCHVNLQLWHIEDAIREKERLKEFDDEFIKLARDVYFTNDKRATLKKEINIKYGSDISEKKNPTLHINKKFIWICNKLYIVLLQGFF